MFTHKLMIVKADDFGRGPLVDSWRRFNDLCLSLSVIPSIGVVGRDFVRNRATQSMARYLYEAMRVEFWNHSFRHKDITKMQSSEVVEDTILCQCAVQDILGYRPKFYGAPFNSTSQGALEAIASTGEFEGFYFAETQIGKIQNLPKNYLLTPEFNTQVLHPVRHEFFRRRFIATADKSSLVLQVHPPYWSPECFSEFRSTLLWCLEQGYQPVTLADYFECVSTRNIQTIDSITTGSLISLSEKIIESAGSKDLSFMPDMGDRSYYFGRLKGPLARTVSFVNSYLLTKNQGPASNSRVLDIGAGTGNWSLSCVAANPKVEALALDQNTDLCNLMQEIVSEITHDQRCKYVVGDATNLQVGQDDIDYCICNNALNYMQHEDVLREVSRVLREDGLFLLGLQTELYPLLDAIRFVAKQDTLSVLNRIDRIFANVARRDGAFTRNNFIRYWSDNEIITSARYAGLHPLLRGLRLPEDYGMFLGRPVLFGYLFIRTAASRRNSIALHDGVGGFEEDQSVLGAAGATQALLRTLKLQRELDRDPKTIIRLLRMLSQDRVTAIPQACASLLGEGISVSGLLLDTACTEAQAFEEGNWERLKASFSARMPRAVAGRTALDWFDFRRTTSMYDRTLTAGSFLDVAFDLGVASSRGDWAGARQVLTTFYSQYDAADIDSYLSGSTQTSNFSLRAHSKAKIADELSNIISIF